MNEFTPEIDAQIREMLHERAISKLMIKFSRFLDEKNFAGYADCYAEHGELVTPWGGHKGRAGLAAHVEKDLGHFVATQHVSASHDIVVTGNKAKARASLLATHTSDQEGHKFWTVGGHYNFDLELINGEWKFVRFEIVPAWSFKNGEESL
jgi:hypothetical protein